MLTKMLHTYTPKGGYIHPCFPSAPGHDASTNHRGAYRLHIISDVNLCIDVNVITWYYIARRRSFMNAERNIAIAFLSVRPSARLFVCLKRSGVMSKCLYPTYRRNGVYLYLRGTFLNHAEMHVLLRCKDVPTEWSTVSAHCCHMDVKYYK